MSEEPELKKSKVEEEREKGPLSLPSSPYEGRHYCEPENLERYCNKLGDALLAAAVEHALGGTRDVSSLLCQWELEMRQPIAQHIEQTHVLEVDALEEIFVKMREMHRTLEEN